MKKVTRLLLVLVFVLLSLSLFCGNGIATEEAMASNESEYQLQYNTLYIENTTEGGMDSPFRQNNCYTYAIGRFACKEGAMQPGDYSGCEFMLSMPVSQMANNIKSDLEELLCTNVVVSTTIPNLQALQPEQEVICIRKGTLDDSHSDFHVMAYNKLVNNGEGGWLHKPGETSILKLNGNPWDYDIWYSECHNYGESYLAMYPYTESVVEYTSTIYYITFEKCPIFDEEQGAYVVNTYQELMNIHSRPQEKWIINSSITMPASSSWEPIPNFSGVLEGNNNYIYNFRYNGMPHDNIGLIAINTGVVQNLNFISPQITVTGGITFTDNINIGIIAGKNISQIINCNITGSSGTTTILSNAQANIGGICGVSCGPDGVNSASVSHISITSNGSVGGIVGTTEEVVVDGQICSESSINECRVTNSELNIYFGSVGGVVGSGVAAITTCTIMQTVVSCYNGYPDIFSEYYPFSHTAYAGGVIGKDMGGIGYDAGFENPYASRIKSCTLTYVSIMCNSDEVDEDIAPEMGLLCGQASLDFYEHENRFLNRYNNVTASNLTEAQKVYVNATGAVGRYVT